MAFTLGDAIVLIGGDKSPLAKTLNSAEKDTNNFVSRAANGIKSAFGTALKVGIGTAVTGIVTMGVMMVSTENQFQNSTEKIQGALGLTEEKALGVGESMRDVWANNFGDSVADVEQSIIDVSKGFERLGGVSNEQLTASTEDAIRLRDMYGDEVSESVGAAATLMEEFGLTSDQAFDFITKGQQNGLNASGDFLDTIGEYSNLFKESGFDADEFFSIMETGAKGGVLGTDKVADSIKEMGIILNEGGDDVSETFADMGMNYEGMAANVRNGSATWADYFPAIIEGLNGIEDPLAKNAAQTALFGTMAEDLGVSFTDGLSTMTTGLEDMTGATDTLDSQYNTWGTTLEGFKRTAIDALTPLSQEILGMANDAMPEIKEAFAGFVDQLIEALPDIIEFVNQFVAFAVEHGPLILKILAGLAVGFSVLGIIATVAGWISAMVTAWGAVSAAIAFVWPLIAGIGALLTGPVLLAIGAVVAVVALLAAAWNNNWFNIQERTAVAVAYIQTLISTLLANLQAWWAENGAMIIATVVTMWETVKATFAEFVATAQSLIAAFKEGMAGDWTAMKAQLVTIATNMIISIVSTIATLWTRVSPILTTALNNMKSAFTSIDWAGIGQSIIEGVKAGLNSAAASLYESLKGIANNALNAAKTVLKINSPSLLFANEVGEPIVEGVEAPLKAGQRRIAAAMENMVQVPQQAALAARSAFGGGGNSSTTNNNVGGSTINVYETGDAKLTARLIENERVATLEEALGF